VDDRKQSTDSIPHSGEGVLREATATDEALQGDVTPIVSKFNARSESGQSYRVLFLVASPQGVIPSSLSQSQKTSGRVHFDVTGDVPESVVYYALGQLIRRQIPAASPGAGVQAPCPNAGGAARTPAAAAAIPVRGGEETLPVPAAAPPPAGWQGTPAGSPGATPPLGWQGAPLLVGRAGVPIPAFDPILPASPPQGLPRPEPDHTPRQPRAQPGRSNSVAGR
jgi:hypothetical protein